ncbi:MAG: GAF domain-containing protein [Xenococcaceae cyanobacterium MO_188.B32]|nr:GAF domain-containing protein [Xenococcaceae cyanobacterium MO_188.B32]
MNHTVPSNPNDDDIFLDIQIEPEEILAESDLTSSEQSSSSVPLAQKTHQSNSWKNPFSWINITKQRLNTIGERHESHNIDRASEEPKQGKNSRFYNLEQIKTRTMAIVITLTMLPLILSSGLIYYFGNRTIKIQEIYSNEKNLELLKEHLKSQKKTLLFLLAGTEVTALLVGIVSALWAQKNINVVARNVSQANSLAIKVDNQQQSQVLAKIVLGIRKSISREDILANAVVETRKALQCDRVIIYQFERQNVGQVIAESVEPRFCEILLTYTEDLGLESKYLSEYQKKRYKVIDNIYQESQLDSQHLSQYESLDIKSCLHVPIEQQGQLMGLLIAYQCYDFHQWRAKEIELCNQIAIEIGLALDDSQLITDCLNLQVQLQETSLWQDYLSDSLECIHSATTEEDIIKTAVEETRRILECDRAVIYRLDHSHQATVTAESVAPDYPKILGTVIEEPCFEAEYYQEPVRIIHDVEEASISPSYREQLANLEVKSLMVAPIIHQDRLYGFLIAHQCSLQRFWQECESKWFKQVAKQVGYSLDNAQLMIQTQEVLQNHQNLTLSKSEKKALIHSQLPVFLEESKISLENFSQKVLAEVDAVTPIFKQMQVMAKSVEGLTHNIDQTKLQSQQVEGILRIEHKNIDLTEDRLIDIQQSLRKIAVKNINLGQSCQQFIQATEQINRLAEAINQQIDKTNFEANRIGIVSEKSLQELTHTVYASTKQLIMKTEAIKVFLDTIKAETSELTTILETSEAKAFIGLEIAQETRQNLARMTARNQEINQLIERITLAATIGEQNSQLAQQSLLEVANLANQAAKKSLTAVHAIASLIQFLEKL